MKVVVVVLNWNGHEDTRECLRSLRKAARPGMEVVVVDNHSTVPGLGEAELEFPEVTFIHNQTNLGFAAGNNVGIREALKRNADLVVLLNNDTVVRFDFLEPLVMAFDGNAKIGCASGTILFHGTGGGNSVWYAGGRLSRLRAAGIMQNQWQRFPLGGKGGVQSTEYVTGCYMAISAAALRTVGLLDEDFFFGVEDFDYSWRVAEHGFALAYVPDSVIWHKVSRSRIFSEDAIYRGYVSKILLVRKRRSWWGFRTWLLLFAAYMLPVGTLATVLRHRGPGRRGVGSAVVVRAVLRAMVDGVAGRLETRQRCTR